jgi:hypothetical protein
MYNQILAPHFVQICYYFFLFYNVRTFSNLLLLCYAVGKILYCILSCNMPVSTHLPCARTIPLQHYIITLIWWHYWANWDFTWRMYLCVVLKRKILWYTFVAFVFWYNWSTSQYSLLYILSIFNIVTSSSNFHFCYPHLMNLFTHLL